MWLQVTDPRRGLENLPRCFKNHDKTLKKSNKQKSLNRFMPVTGISWDYSENYSQPTLRCQKKVKWAQSLSRVGFDKPGRGSRDISYKYNFALQSLHAGTVLYSELTPCWASTEYLYTQGSSLTHSASLFPAAHVLVTRNNVLTLSLAAKGARHSADLGGPCFLLQRC